MCLRFLSLLACILAVTDAAIKDEKSAAGKANKKSSNERIAALYVKEGNENGELRFLTGTGSSSSTSLNALINQYITQQQNALEQLRPTGTTGTFTSGLGTGTSSTTSGVTPIIVNLGAGTTGTTASTSAVNAVINNSSPIGDLLPQIIAQAVRRGPNTRRRGQANRRPAGNRGGNRPQVFLVRP